MTTLPHITVQLVHIQGPLKGEIQEFGDGEIGIGRHPDCQVQFPKEVTTLSRRHARIVREGNRFKLIDQSINGTYVNGQRVPETYLKDGDVITFADGGPKVSFLTHTSDQPIAPSQPVQPQTSPSQPPVQSVPQPRPPMEPYAAVPSTPPSPSPPSQPVADPASGPPLAIETVQVPFAIQYGPALKSFQSLPITLGKGAGSDFVINHPALIDQHAQIFFAQEQYWIKDLTGGNAVMLNGVPIHTQAPLEPDMQLALSAQGPKFRFLGGGRLAELEDPLPEPQSQASTSQAPPAAPDAAAQPDKPGKKAGSLFKKFFR